MRGVPSPQFLTVRLRIPRGPVFPLARLKNYSKSPILHIIGAIGKKIIFVTLVFGPTALASGLASASSTLVACLSS